MMILLPLLLRYYLVLGILSWSTEAFMAADVRTFWDFAFIQRKRIDRVWKLTFILSSTTPHLQVPPGASITLLLFKGGRSQTTH